MKQNLVFQINKTKNLDFSILSEKEILQNPVFEHYLSEVQQCLVVYTYHPAKNFNKSKFTEILIKGLKKKYNASSVVFLGSKIEEFSLSN
jgi:UDP-N-acetylglucosamine 2-epimerase